MMQTIVGNITWPALIARPILAILHAVYKFAESGDKLVRAMGRDCKEELLLCLMLMPLLEADLTLDWSDFIAATDASETGFGGVHRQTTKDEVEKLAQLSERRGDYITLDDRHDVGDLIRNIRLGKAKRRQGQPHRLGLVEDDFKTHLAGRWKRLGGHINAYECEALLLHLKWLGRNVRHLAKKHVVFVDSKVTLHCVVRGRSSARALAAVLRRVGAYLLALGIRLHLIWFPSEFNPADRPSRKFDAIIQEPSPIDLGMGWSGHAH
jgi:hypothetical protein